MPIRLHETRSGKETQRLRPRGTGTQREKRRLPAVVMVMMVVMMMGAGSERRTCKHHQ